jgi:hypothetical protein
MRLKMNNVTLACDNNCEVCKDIDKIIYVFGDNKIINN